MHSGASIQHHLKYNGPRLPMHFGNVNLTKRESKIFGKTCICAKYVLMFFLSLFPEQYRIPVI